MKYLIASVIILLAVFTAFKVGAELPKIYQAVPGIHHEVTVMKMSGYWNDKDKLIEVINTFINIGHDAASTKFNEFALQGYYDAVNTGYVPVSNCEFYAGWTVCEITR